MFKATILETIPFLRKKKERSPRHIAITVEDNLIWQKKNRKTAPETFTKRDAVLYELIREQVSRGIPIMTFLLIPAGRRDPDELDCTKLFFQGLKRHSLVHQNQMKLSILGKWYDLPGVLVREIKDCIDETKHYDRYFLNFCVNYDGQEEIVDSCRLISRSVLANKLDSADISTETIKENLYSSYFLPPELIIKTGMRKTWSTLLLWDSTGAYFHYAGKVFNDVTITDLTKAIEESYANR
jgi:undecaprenyl diphosphate synthase